MHFGLGLLLATCYIPGITGAMIPTQWSVLSIVLPLCLWQTNALGPVHWAGLAVLAWSALSFLWVVNQYDAVYGLWLAMLWAGSFWLGTVTLDFEPILKGLAAGLGVSSAVAIAQAFGFDGIYMFTDNPAGLLYNSTVLGSTCALILIALVSHALWRWVPLVLPGLYLAHSRGAWLILGAVILTRIHWALTIALLASVGTGYAYFAGDSDSLRLTVWGHALRELTPFGRGIGSFNSYFFIRDGQIMHPEYVHNDYIQLLFELGPAAAIVFAIYAICLWQRSSPYHATFLGFAILGTFYFPLWTPLTAFIGCMCAGRLVSDWHLVRNMGYPSRSNRLSWFSSRQQATDRTCNPTLPVVPLH
jgi:hypothetical protein